MSHSGASRAHRSSACRAWAGGLDESDVAQLQRRVSEDSAAIVALLFAHAGEWDTAELPATESRGKPTP